MATKQSARSGRYRKPIASSDQDFICLLPLVDVLLNCSHALEDVALPLPERGLDLDRIDLDLLVLDRLLGRRAVSPFSVASRGPAWSLLSQHVVACSMEMLLCVLPRHAMATQERLGLPRASCNMLVLPSNLGLLRLVLYLVVTRAAALLTIADVHL